MNNYFVIGWYPGNTATATQVIRYNLSVAYALRGELDKAQGLIKEVSILTDHYFLCSNKKKL